MNTFRPSLAMIDLAGAAVIVVGALATYYLGISPAQQAAAVERADCEALSATKAQADAAALEVRTATVSLATLRSQVAANATVLRPPSDLFTQIQAITLSAQSHALTISGINPSLLVVGARFSRIPIHLAGAGPYPDFSAFLRELHAAHPDLQVVSFRLTGRADDPKAAPTFEADLNWYTSTGADKPSPAAGSGKGGGGVQGGGGVGNGLSAPGAPSQAPTPRNP